MRVAVEFCGTRCVLSRWLLENQAGFVCATLRSRHRSTGQPPGPQTLDIVLFLVLSCCVTQVAQALDDGGALVSYGGMSLRPITLPASVLQVCGGVFLCCWCSRDGINSTCGGGREYTPLRSAVIPFLFLFLEWQRYCIHLLQLPVVCTARGRSQLFAPVPALNFHRECVSAL